jgi:hypothetical protein
MDSDQAKTWRETMRKIRNISIVCLCFLAAVVSLPLNADEAKPRRGEFPKCQTACLAEHTRKMDKLAAMYEGERDKISFQEIVDNAVSEYRACIDNCRYPLPVK